MRTGLQRIEENVKFLKSVPLLQNLDDKVLSKIADVLELVSQLSFMLWALRAIHKLDIASCTSGTLEGNLWTGISGEPITMLILNLVVRCLPTILSTLSHLRLISVFLPRLLFQCHSKNPLKDGWRAREERQKLLVNVCLFIQIIRSFIQLMLTSFGKALSVTISF